MGGSGKQGDRLKMYNSVKILLTASKSNLTYHGTLVLRPRNHNTSLIAGSPVDGGAVGNDTASALPYDNAGASYYVIAVVLVYGFSIVLLIASHISRRHAKEVEDKQIDKYLQDFQIVKEASARDNYRSLKRSIMTKINWERSNRDAYRTLKRSVLPLIAIGMPGGTQPNGFPHGVNYERRRSSFCHSNVRRDRRNSNLSVVNGHHEGAGEDGVLTTLVGIIETEQENEEQERRESIRSDSELGILHHHNDLGRQTFDVIIESMAYSDHSSSSNGGEPHSDSGIGEQESGRASMSADGSPRDYKSRGLPSADMLTMLNGDVSDESPPPQPPPPPSHIAEVCNGDSPRHHNNSPSPGQRHKRHDANSNITIDIPRPGGGGGGGGGVGGGGLLKPPRNIWIAQNPPSPRTVHFEIESQESSLSSDDSSNLPRSPSPKLVRYLLCPPAPPSPNLSRSRSSSMNSEQLEHITTSL